MQIPEVLLTQVVAYLKDRDDNMARVLLEMLARYAVAVEVPPDADNSV